MIGDKIRELWDKTSLHSLLWQNGSKYHGPP